MTQAEIRRDYATLVRDHVQRADGVICVSEHTASEARIILDVPAAKIAVIPNGVDPAYREPICRGRGEGRPGATPPAREARSSTSGATRSARTSGTWPWRTWASRQRRPHVPPLVLVGPGSHWAQGGTISRAQILATGYMETRDIRALMAASAALVLPSLEEGFGLPVAEAMAAGLPVVCSKGSGLEEVAGGAATLVNPMDTASIAKGMERMLDDPEQAALQRRLGLEQSRKFDWDVAAARTLDFYRHVLAS